MLDFYSILWAEENFRTIYWLSESNAFLRDLTHLSKTENLKSTGISENRAIPVDKFMQATLLLHHICTRPQHKVKSIAQYNISAGLLDLIRRQPFNTSVCPDWHKGWGLNHS